MRSTSITILSAVVVSGLAGLWGCGPNMIELESESETGSESASSTDTPTPTSAGTPTTGSTNTPTTGPDSESGDTTGDTGLPDEGGYEDDGDGTGCTFTCPDPPPPPPMGGTCNCPSDEKCMPWSNTGEEDWNAIRCSPIDGNPAGPGEECFVEVYQWSGIDNCDGDSMCLVTDHKTNMGICVPFCAWLGDGGCPEDFECQTLTSELMIPVCEPVCDPTLDDCPGGFGCFPGGSSFTCQATIEIRIPVGLPCEEPEFCESGALCVFGPSPSCGQAAGEGCCAAACDMTVPDACPMPTTCTSWFGAAGPEDWDHVGYCAD